MKQVPAKRAPAPGRNEPCRCGSGRKYKRCCWDSDQFPTARARDERIATTEARLAAMTDAERDRRSREVRAVLGLAAGLTTSVPTRR